MSNRATKLSGHESVPMAELEKSAAKVIARARSSGKPVVVTESGEPTAVVLSSEQYEELTYRHAFLTGIQEGLDDVEHGRTLSTEQVKDALAKKFGPIA